MVSGTAIPTSPRFMVVFPADTSRGWRVVRKVRVAEGEKHVASGDWLRVVDPVSGQAIGYQMCTAHGTDGDYDIRSSHAPSAISATEMEINAGVRGASSTARLSEDRRLQRVKPEDVVERTRRKVIVWPHVGARRQDILRVWPAE